MPNIIGAQITKLRSSRGMTQEDLGIKLGYSKQTVSNWETGLKTPRMGAIQKLSDFFGVNKSYIIDGIEEDEEVYYNSIVDSILQDDPTTKEIVSKLIRLNEEELNMVNETIDSLLKLKEKRA